jgi:hypothetical protein
MYQQQTTLDLNGPFLSFTTQPVGVSSAGVGVGSTGGGTATFVGIATATFTTVDGTPTNPATNTGSIAYQWYEEGVGALSNSTYVTGTATTTLTLSNLITPTDNQRKFYVEADYIPSAYQSSSPVTAGTARSTGNAINEPLNSNTATVTVFPLITITSQPGVATVTEGFPVNFSVDAVLSDSTFGSLSYQWQFNNQNLSDNALIQGSSGKTLTITSSPPYAGAVDGIIGHPVCISVIDESSPSAEVTRTDWLSFRGNYPNRNFWLLQPGKTKSELKIPTEYETDSKAFYRSVNRDNGNISNRSNWFIICNLASYPVGTVISLSIDNSGSLGTATVQASYYLFKQKCAQAGLDLRETPMSDERYIPPHNKDLPVTISTAVGISTVRAIVSNPNAPSVISNNANLNVVSILARKFVNFEYILLSSSTSQLLQTNLFDDEYIISQQSNQGLVSFYSPETDIDVEMDLYGGKGNDNKTYLGGEGGFSRIRFTMIKNTEYVIVGLNSTINTPFIYRKGTLIATVGAGGNAGTFAKGGFGGGIGVSGTKGNSNFGYFGGTGGEAIRAGNLPSNGIYGSATNLTAISPDTQATAPNGGRVLPCTRGTYWRQQGVSPCSDVGTTQFRLPSGTIVTNTASIVRGFKAGYGINETAGQGFSILSLFDPTNVLTLGDGNGGSGATGGQGGSLGFVGGGGGSGYTDGSVTVVSTQLGGSTEDAKVILRLVV